MPKVHPNQALIAKWNEDNNTVLQMDISHTKEEWFDCDIITLINSPGRKFRIKPREFTKGHWYPCMFEGRKFICLYNGKVFAEPINHSSRVSSITWDYIITKGLVVGKSLGEIKFGE